MLGLVARLLGGAITPLVDQFSASSARLLRKLALFLVAGISLVVVLLALTIAFDLWIASLAGAIAGALAVAGVYLLVALVAIYLALRPAQPRRKRNEGQRPQEQAAEAAESRLDAQIDGFVAPLLRILQNLGLRREQLAVLAGTSLAKQVGPLPLVGLAILAGFLIGRMWGGWRAILRSDLVTTLLSTDILASLFGAARSQAADEPADPPGDG